MCSNIGLLLIGIRGLGKISVNGLSLSPLPPAIITTSIFFKAAILFARGDIEIQVLGKNVVLNFTPSQSEEKELPQLLQETLNAREKAEGLGGKVRKIHRKKVCY